MTAKPWFVHVADAPWNKRGFMTRSFVYEASARRWAERFIGDGVPCFQGGEDDDCWSGHECVVTNIGVDIGWADWRRTLYRRGREPVDQRLRETQPGVFTIGDWVPA